GGPRRADLAGGAAADRAHPPAARAAGPPRLPGLRRRQIRRRTHLRQGHPPARPGADVPAPGPLRTAYASRRAAPAAARAVRLPLPRGPPVSEAVLRAMRDLIQEDPGGRGLARDPESNLINACPEDFAAACQSIAEAADAGLGVVTGFYTAHADP